MPRKYSPKNPEAKGAKLPPQVLLAIKKQYCKGKTQTEAARVVSRWARAHGIPPRLSRQSVNARYVELGDLLWRLQYVEIGEVPPGYSPTNRGWWHYLYKMSYVDLTRETIVADQGDIERYERMRQTRVLPKDYPYPTFRVEYFDSLYLRELREMRRKMSGFRKETFYVHHMRAWWLDYLHKCHPADSRKALMERLFKLINRPYRRLASVRKDSPHDDSERSNILIVPAEQAERMGRILFRLWQPLYKLAEASDELLSEVLAHGVECYIVSEERLRLFRKTKSGT